MEEEKVTKIVNEGMAIFEPNTYGPKLYVSVYEKFLYIILGEAKTSLDDFFKEDPFPFLKVFFLIFLSPSFLSRHRFRISLKESTNTNPYEMN